MSLEDLTLYVEKWLRAQDHYKNFMEEQGKMVDLRVGAGEYLASGEPVVIENVKGKFSVRLHAGAIVIDPIEPEPS